MTDHFFCVHEWMMKDLGLRGNERDVFAVIYSFTESRGVFTGGAQYLADRTGVARPSVCVTLKKLLQKDMLAKTERMEKGLKYCDYRVSDQCLSRISSLPSFQKPSPEPVMFSDTACQQTLQVPVMFSDGACQETLHHNKEYNKKDNKGVCKGDNEKVSRGTGKAKATPARHAYGEYQNVLLSDEELEKLKREYPEDWKQKVDHLSEYMASTGKRYHNHLATIRLWAKKDAPPEKPKGRFADLKGGVML